MPISITGTPSVLDRTVFTNYGPIVKSPIAILSGLDAYIYSPSELNIPSANFVSSYVGKTVTITGSPGGRNDGTFFIKTVKTPKIIELEDANFDYSNPTLLTSNLISLSNELKLKVNQHFLSNIVHSNSDTINSVVSPNSVDVASACILLNEIKLKLTSHSVLVGIPEVHLFSDPDSSLFINDATDLPSALLLCNRLRSRYELHRRDRNIHLEDDFNNRINTPPVKQYVGTGALIGPFGWTIQDPRNGQIADEPTDVSVTVNGSPATVDYVFGLLGAVVLNSKPNPGDSVFIDYKYIKNPPTQFERLNSFEFVLNQEGNRNNSGIPTHLYRQRSFLLNGADPRLVKSPYGYQKIGYKYKAYELEYTTRLNDPNSLLLNSPTNKIMYPVLNEYVKDDVIRYDPLTLPNTATDPWMFYGEGIINLVNNPYTLIINDNIRSYGVDPGPPFYSHTLDLTYPSLISAAYRLNINEDTIVYDGDFSGVGFGFTLGLKSVILGYIETEANNLSSSISLVNNIKYLYTYHINSIGVHQPLDVENQVLIVDAYDLPSLIILTNHLLHLFNDHILTGPNNIHLNPDLVNGITVPDCVDLNSAMFILNTLRVNFNQHRIQSNVHYVNDTINECKRVKQVGILSNSGFMEDQYSWSSFAYDWTVETTYRLYIDSSGNSSVYLSGDVNPRCALNNSSLPNASDVDLRFDPVHQAFFGSLGDNSSSVSNWRFARINVLPVNTYVNVKNKDVLYDFSTTPELDSNYPWITVGQGGTERLISANTLAVDSMACVLEPVETAAGYVTGEYRGYLRIEPSITDSNTLIADFTAYSSLSSFGVDNRSLGLFIGDGTYATQLCFLQANPSPAVITGTVYEGSFSISTDDTAVFTIDNGPIIVATALSNITTVIGLVTLLNAASNLSIGASVASAFTNISGTTLRIASPSLGAESVIRVISGQIFDKLGIVTGAYTYGIDSKPEAKVSWAGIDLPDLDYPAWAPNGNQPARMLERTLVIDDSSTSDFKSYTQSSALITNPVILPTDNWKSDFRVRVKSFTVGQPISSSTNYKYCGLLFNIDEGSAGKNLEVHFSYSLNDLPYIVIYSYNLSTNSLDFITSFSYSWNDSSYHSISLYTDKASNNISLFIDASYYGSITYSSLNPGAFGPSINFGSGANPLNNCDLRSALSVTEWTSISAIHDSTVNNPFLASQRYLGLYRGGPTDRLSSYYTTPIDWRNPHTYRLVRDPSSNVAVYIDSSPVASISAPFDVLTLPLNSVNYLSGVVPSGKFIAFGSFSYDEITRSIWADSLSYSIGKITLTNGVVPFKQVLNRANVIASPEHLKSNIPHEHNGFNAYSGGTPTDEFMSDPALSAFTELGSRTPPFALSQDLTSQGGLISQATPIDTVSATSLIYQSGALSNFIDDLVNVHDSTPLLTYSLAVTTIINDTADLSNKYLNHRNKFGLNNVHDILDSTSLNFPVPVDFTTLLSSLVLGRDSFNQHRSAIILGTPVHINDDTINSVSFSNPVDLNTAVLSYNLLVNSYNKHLASYLPHKAPGSSSNPLSFCIASLNLLKDLMPLHMNNVNGAWHATADAANANAIATFPYCNDLLSAVNLANTIKLSYNFHLLNVISHTIADLVNTVTAPDSVDINSLLSLVNDIITKYNDHIADVGGPFHAITDTFNNFVPDSNLEFLVRYLSDAQNLINNHVIDISLHNSPDQTSQFYDSLIFNLNATSTTCDIGVYTNFANLIKSKLQSHLFSDSHISPDHVNGDIIVALPEAVDFTSSMLVVTTVLSALSDHNSTPLSNETLSHSPDDLTELAFISTSYDPLPVLILKLNELKSHILAHFDYKPSHVKIDTPFVTANAQDLLTAISLVNSIKSYLNNHFISSGVHAVNDTTNTISTPNAIDLDSAINLYNSVISSYNSHRVTAGVHSNTTIIRLTPPSGVLFDKVTFWNIDTGVPDVTSTFSDDETYKLDGIYNTKKLRINYPGTELPEKVTLVGSTAAPWNDLPGKLLNISIDNNSPIVVGFAVGETSAASVVTRINNTPGIPLGFASSTPGGNIILTNPNSGVGRTIYLFGPANEILGLDTSQPIPWTLNADDTGSVSISLVSGTPDYLSYTTTGSGTKTAYVASTQLTDEPSHGFSIKFRVRINTWSYDPDGNTGIYLGCSSKVSGGFTLGIGFALVGGVRSITLKDMNSGIFLGYRAFDWGDGAFHTYVISRDVVTDSMQLEIIP